MTFIQNFGGSSFFGGGSAIGQKSLAEQPLVTIPQSQNTVSGYDFNYGLQPQANPLVSMLMASLMQMMLGSWLGSTIGNALGLNFVQPHQNDLQGQLIANAREELNSNFGNLKNYVVGPPGSPQQELFQTDLRVIELQDANLAALQQVRAKQVNQQNGLTFAVDEIETANNPADAAIATLKLFAQNISEQKEKYQLLGKGYAHLGLDKSLTYAIDETGVTLAAEQARIKLGTQKASDFSLKGDARLPQIEIAKKLLQKEIEKKSAEAALNENTGDPMKDGKNRMGNLGRSGVIELLQKQYDELNALQQDVATGKAPDAGSDASGTQLLAVTLERVRMAHEFGGTISGKVNVSANSPETQASMDVPKQQYEELGRLQRKAALGESS